MIARGDFVPRMTRLSAYCSAFALCFVAVAQGWAQAPGAASTDANHVNQFQKIEDTWSKAINLRDQYGLELALSPLFVGVSASGDITNRDQQVANMISRDDKTLHLKQHVISVRMLGDVAVANGTYTLHHRVKSGEVDQKGVFTHVFTRDHGRWKCVNSQRTLVREEDTAQKKDQKKSGSSFHIPLFSRDKKN